MLTSCDNKITTEVRSAQGMVTRHASHCYILAVDRFKVVEKI
jgi:hypothetical protein